MMAKRGVRGVLKAAAEVVGPSGMSDVGLLSNKTVHPDRGVRETRAPNRDNLRVVFRGPTL